MTKYEYVVWANLDGEIHRGPWTERECIDWLEETREIFPVGAKIDKLWSVRRRAVGEWETYGTD
jgi:hypothetical protein